MKNPLKKTGRESPQLPQSFRTVTFASPFGALEGVIDGERLCGLSWGLSVGTLSVGVTCGSETDSCFLAVSRWLDGYLAGRQEPFDRRWLDFDGLSPATLRLYDVLATVPYGQCVTYGMVAAAMASSPRAVGQLLCRNRFALVIPCHRVVGATSLKGYGGKDGGKRKKALLDWEGAKMPF